MLLLPSPQSPALSKSVEELQTQGPFLSRYPRVGVNGLETPKPDQDTWYGRKPQIQSLRARGQHSPIELMDHGSLSMAPHHHLLLL